MCLNLLCKLTIANETGAKRASKDPNEGLQWLDLCFRNDRRIELASGRFETAVT